MALNNTLVVFADGNPIDVLRSYPVLDKPATRVLAERLFPGTLVEEIGDELLVDALNPPAGIAVIGCFAGLDLICSWGITPQRPSELGPEVLAASSRRNVFLHAAHGDAEWCSYGVWRDGVRVRALSVSGTVNPGAGPDAGPGVIEDEGEPLPFEARERPDDLASASMQALFGFACDDNERLDDVDPELIPVVAYRVSKAS